MIVDGTVLPNLRDVGGHATRKGGRVRTGILFRSSAPVDHGPADMAALARLDLRTVYDLRSVDERAAAPDALPEGVRHRCLDVAEDATDPSVVLLDRLMVDPVAARAFRGGIGAADMPERRFRDLVRLESARLGYGALFLDVSDEAHRPALVHCSTGKDRTGWAVAALLLLLGVADDEVLDDYMASARALELLLLPALEAFIDAGGDPELFEWIAGVRPQNLEAALDEISMVYGSIDGYFELGLGLDAPRRAALRHAFVEPPPSR